MSTELLNLDEAEKAFAVANTPLFLLRKLQSDQNIASWADQEKDAVNVYKCIESALKIVPNTFREAVLPYALLVAISRKEDPALLRKAGELTAEHYPWFRYLSTALIANFRSTSVQTIHTNGYPPRPTCAQSRMPIDLIWCGMAMSLFQASHATSMISS
jgi:hypothetical protein